MKEKMEDEYIKERKTIAIEHVLLLFYEYQTVKYFKEKHILENSAFHLHNDVPFLIFDHPSKYLPVDPHYWKWNTDTFGSSKDPSEIIL